MSDAADNLPQDDNTEEEIPLRHNPFMRDMEAFYANLRAQDTTETTEDTPAATDEASSAPVTESTVPPVAEVTPPVVAEATTTPAPEVEAVTETPTTPTSYKGFAVHPSGMALYDPYMENPDNPTVQAWIYGKFDEEGNPVPLLNEEGQEVAPIGPEKYALYQQQYFRAKGDFDEELQYREAESIKSGAANLTASVQKVREEFAGYLPAMADEDRADIVESYHKAAAEGVQATKAVLVEHYTKAGMTPPRAQSRAEAMLLADPNLYERHLHQAVASDLPGLMQRTVAATLRYHGIDPTKATPAQKQQAETVAGGALNNALVPPAAPVGARGARPAVTQEAVPPVVGGVPSGGGGGGNVPAGTVTPYEKAMAVSLCLPENYFAGRESELREREKAAKR